MAGIYAQRGEGVSFYFNSESDNRTESLTMDDGSQRIQNLARRMMTSRACRKADYWDFLWLVYSVFFFIEPIARRNASYWVEFAAFYAVFLTLYSGIVLARQRWVNYACLAAMAVLGLAYYPQNNGATGCVVYVAAFLPFVCESLAVSLGGFSVLCLALIIEGILLHTSPWAWAFGSFFTFVVGGTNLFMAQRIRANSKLQLAHEEIEQLAKVAERERIARDLHDVLGHTLSVVVLKSELAGRLVSGDPARARAEIADVEQIARKALSEVREAISGYRSEGLAAEIKRAQTTLDTAGVRLVCEEQPPSLSPAEETVMALILREAVTNVVRHAQASQCVVRFVSQEGKPALVVEDNGRGGIRQEGNGLRGIRERIEALGGRFAIDGTQGTRLTIELRHFPS
ncbi:MAG TPA: sensor histidine kinase [Acidobacteriaceae bacterium]|nr:sensor histidine kinase [Acidobacteriaceae bacterium]